MSQDRKEMINRKGEKEVLLRKRKGEVEYLSFPGIEKTGLVNHMFTTRKGGVSEGIFASMNLSYTRGDEKSSVDENYRRIAAVFDSTPDRVVCSDQTHTTNVRLVTETDAGKGVVRDKDYTDVDGLITNVPGLILATFYADCVPLYFVDTENRAIGLSHSGWKGTVQSIAAKTLARMTEAFGTQPRDVLVGIGPSIGPCCYEVGAEVAARFCAAFPYAEELLLHETDGHVHLDLWEANRQQLLRSGVSEENIEVAGECTCCRHAWYYSYRADQGKTGRIAALISLRS